MTRKNLALKASADRLFELLGVKADAVQAVIYIDMAGGGAENHHHPMMLRGIEHDTIVVMVLDDVAAKDAGRRMDDFSFSSDRLLLLFGNLSTEEVHAVFQTYRTRSAIGPSEAKEIAATCIHDHFGEQAKRALGDLGYLGIVVNREELPSTTAIIQGLRDDALLVDLTEVKRAEPAAKDNRRELELTHD